MKNEKGKQLSEREKSAKIKVVEAMRDLASSQMGEKLKGLKKVTVASNNESGLKAGLEKAKELIAGKAGESLDESSEPAAEEALAETEEEATEEPELSEEEINAKLEELMAAKAKLSARKG